MLMGSRHLEFGDRVTDQLYGMDEAQPIGVHPLLLGVVNHDLAYGIIGDR